MSTAKTTSITSSTQEDRIALGAPVFGLTLDLLYESQVEHTISTGYPSAALALARGPAGIRLSFASRST